MRKRKLQTSEDIGTDETSTAESNESETSTNLLDTIKEGADNLLDEAKDILQTTPTDWTTGQIVGVAIGSVIILLLLFFLYYCFCRRCKCRGNSKKYALSKPSVIRGPGSAVDARRMLPLGVRLHGAEKLREAGLTGRGVRVAVIDSGIDASHIGFDDKVMAKKWYRYGTPLSEDDQ